MNRRSQIVLRIQNVIFVILFMAVIGMLAWLGKTYQKDFDLTRSQQNSLHASTQKLLKRLDKPLTLTAFVPDDAVVHTALKKLVLDYKKYKQDIQLELVNPELDPQRAKKEGIAYSGLMKVAVGERSEIIKSVDEQTMVDAIQRLSREKPRLVVFIEGHGERSPLIETPNGLSSLAETLESKGFFFQPHNILRTQSIPSDANMVVIAAPQQDYLEGEVKILTDYVKQGGNLLWLHEPGSLYGLDDLEQLLDLELHEGTIVDADGELQEMLGIKHPAVIPVITYGASEITRDLASHTLFPFPTAILRDEQDESEDEEVEPAEEWRYQPLLTTLTTSWLESGEMVGNVKFDDVADKPGPLSIAMSLQRAKTDDESAETKQREQRIIVVGDSDFLTNSFINQGSNLELTSNLFNWIGEDDNLLSIGAISAPDATLELPPWALYSSALFFLFGLPGLLILVGMLRWLRRRKR